MHPPLRAFRFPCWRGAGVHASPSVRVSFPMLKGGGGAHPLCARFVSHAPLPRHATAVGGLYRTAPHRSHPIGPTRVPAYMTCAGHREYRRTGNLFSGILHRHVRQPQPENDNLPLNDVKSNSDRIPFSETCHVGDSKSTGRSRAADVFRGIDVKCWP